MKTNIKRFLVCSLLFILLVSALSNSFARGSSYIECDCGSDPCTCFIQEGDEGGFVKAIITLLIEKEYLPEKTPVGLFTPAVTQAVLIFQKDHHLEPTGTMDDDTLTLLIWDKLPEELDRVMPLIPGVCSTYPYVVYVPTDGGKDRHANPECSGMKDPRKVSVRNAEAVQFYACTIPGCEASVENLLNTQ